MTELSQNETSEAIDLQHYLRRLTIVVPTYGRPAEVLKTIEFWRGKGPNLLILDGSPDPILDFCSLGNLDHLTYVHTQDSMRSRLVQSFEYIRTEYVTLCGDDEVHLPSSLADSIRELDQSSALVSCMGWALGFSSKVGRNAINNLLGHRCYPGLQFLDNTQDTARDRLASHFDKYVPSNIYSVVRIDAFGNALKLLAAPGDLVGGQLELEFEIAMLYQGGNKVLANLHWLRNFGYTERFIHEFDMNPNLPFYECFLDPDWLLWKQEFLLTRSRILSEIDGNDVQEVILWLEEALQRYSKYILELRKSSSRFARALNYFRSHWRNRLTKNQYSKVRAILQTLNRRDYGQDLQETAEALGNLGMNYSKNELSQVVRERFLT